MRLNWVGSSVVSAMTHTPASRPWGLETTPPMSFPPIVIAATSFCGWPQAGTDTPTNNAAAARRPGSLFLIFMSPSLPASAGPPLFQRDLLVSFPLDSPSSPHLVSVNAISAADSDEVARGFRDPSIQIVSSQRTLGWSKWDSNTRSRGVLRSSAFLG